jgi:hypothetical protein
MGWRSPIVDSEQAVANASAQDKQPREFARREWEVGNRARTSAELVVQIMIFLGALDRLGGALVAGGCHGMAPSRIGLGSPW